MATNYWGTKVPVARSVEGIRKIVGKFGASRFAFLDDFESRKVGVQFAHKGIPVEFVVNLDTMVASFLQDRPWRSRMHRTQEVYEAEVFESAKPVAMRVLHDQLKAAFIAVEYGLITFEDVFLSKVVLINGQTVGDILIPKLHDVVNNPGRLLGSGRA